MRAGQPAGDKGITRISAMQYQPAFVTNRLAMGC